MRQRGDVPLLRPALRLCLTRGAVEGVEDGDRGREVEQPEGEQRRVGRPRRQQREEEAGRTDRAEDHAVERWARHQDDRREEGQRHRHDEVEAKRVKPDRRVRLDARAPRHEPLVLEPGDIDFRVGPDRRRRPERRYAEGPGAGRLCEVGENHERDEEQPRVGGDVKLRSMLHAVPRNRADADCGDDGASLPQSRRVRHDVTGGAAERRGLLHFDAGVS
mmetsp:Transcript_7181/g.23700  ORF Transcript_7181/g.23700 Transcript_7181/m.23700 type:complete len:219 (-) Transcript_7181:9-665(-)